MRKFFTVITILTILAATTPVLAQDQPEEVDFVLGTLASALGITLTPDMVSEVQWQETVYFNTALGCPQPGVVYDPIEIAGYQIILVYEGIQYDYRVTQGSEYVVLCGTEDTTLLSVPATSDPAVVVTTVDTSENTGYECTLDLLTRVTVGQQIRTTPILGSNIRTSPDLNAEDIGTIPPSAIFTVVGGPECGPDGYLWWQVEYDGITGWTVQGQEGLYYIEPIPDPLLVTNQAITSANATQITAISQIYGNLLSISAWSPDATNLAIVDASTANPAIWLYNPLALEQPPISIEVDFDVTALAFSPDGSLIAAGSSDGEIYLISVDNYAILLELPVHDTAIGDITFSPDGRYMIAIDDNYTAHFFGVVTP